MHEVDRARETVALVAPHERERVEDYRRRIDIAGVIESGVADRARGHPRHQHH